MTLELPDVGACLSPDRAYRYWLGRMVPDATLGSELRRVLFVLLNPSTADETKNDPTVRKVLRYAKEWGFARLDVVNLFGFRTKSPQVLAQAFRAGTDIVGPENDAYLEAAARRAHRVVVAWGGRVPTKLKKSRPAAVLERLRAAGKGRWVPEYLERAKDGTPVHPLYLLGSLVPQPLPTNDD
jgi:hypothetical protein